MFGNKVQVKTIPDDIVSVRGNGEKLVKLVMNHSSPLELDNDHRTFKSDLDANASLCPANA